MFNKIWIGEERFSFQNTLGSKVKAAAYFEQLNVELSILNKPSVSPFYQEVSEEHADPEDVEGDGVYRQPPLQHGGADCPYFIEGAEFIVKQVTPPKDIQAYVISDDDDPLTLSPLYRSEACPGRGSSWQARSGRTPSRSNQYLANKLL